MYLLSIKNFLKAILFFSVFFFLSISFISAQSTFRITKPIIGTNQICSSTNNYYNNLSYAFSSNVVNLSEYSPNHFVELSNENGLIQPREIGCFTPYVNVIYVGYIDINGQSLPAGTGYRIRVFSKLPSAFSDYSESFSVLSSPAIPLLNVNGSVSLCTGATQTLTVTNPNNSYTYQWLAYSSNISNATNTSYIASTNGSYSVKVTNASGCGIVSDYVSLSIPYALSSSMQTFNNGNNNGYSAYGIPFFIKSNESFTLRAGISGGRPPFNYTLNDGVNNTVETNINSFRDYQFTSPVSGVRTYTISTITDACGSQLNNSSSLRVRINDSKYCPNYGLGTQGIKNFSIQGTTINNLNSGKAGDGWGESFTAANMNANVNYNFTIQALSQAQQYFSIFVDLNQNGLFETGERIFPASQSSSSQSITNSFTNTLRIPANAFSGQTRMRVMLGSDSYYIGNYPCVNSQNGEIEDYVLNVYNGVTPTTITTDSLPILGVCQGNQFPLKYTISGTPLPTTTAYKVEASTYADFSFPTIIGTGTSSPIICNSSLINYYYSSGFYVRVVPVVDIITKIINKAPNLLFIKTKPVATLLAGIYDPYYYYNSVKKLSIQYGTPISVFGRTGGAGITLELNDGRTFSSLANGDIPIDNNILLTTNRKYKTIRVSDNVCTNTTSDSIMISVGNPYLKIMKVYKAYYDTTAIDKLCGTFNVRFAGEFLDTLTYKFYHVQISDINGSFANPQDIGHICTTRVLTEAEGGQEINCSIPVSLQLPPGKGYRLRVVKKTGNLISPVFATTFELFNTSVSITSNLSRNSINEGEVTALNVNFSGGAPPYSIYLNSYPAGGGQIYNSPVNSGTITVNLAPIHGQKYNISYSNTCGGYNSSSTDFYLNVKTQDKNNARWYIKPFQQTSYHELTNKMVILSSTDTLFKRPYNNYMPSDIVNGYYDYNSINLQKPSVILKNGETYSLIQTSNFSSSSFENLLTGVWIDSNHDGDFDDVGEELIKNQFAQHWNTSQNQSFTVPNGSNTGFTRLRIRVVSKQYNGATFDFEPSNPIDRVGNTFDISVVILSNNVTSIISTPKITGNTLCNGNTFSLEFDRYGIPAGTAASVQLSDVSGNFPVNPTVIGQSTTSPINVILPLDIPSGNYNIRVVSNGVTSPVSPSFNVTTNQLISMVNGDWHAGSTWSCGRVPTFVDATTVAGGTTVTVFSGDARVGSIITNGVLSFLNGTTLQFRTP